MTEDVPREKQIRIMEISMTPVLAVPFVVLFYFLYLKETGIEMPVFVFINYILLAIATSMVVCLALNEVLLKLSGGKFRFRRLVFRWTLLTSYFFLVWGVSFFLAVLFPSAQTFQFLFGALIATLLFMIAVLKLRHLFDRFDKGEW